MQEVLRRSCTNTPLVSWSYDIQSHGLPVVSHEPQAKSIEMVSISFADIRIIRSGYLLGSGTKSIRNQILSISSSMKRADGHSSHHSMRERSLYFSLFIILEIESSMHSRLLSGKWRDGYIMDYSLSIEIYRLSLYRHLLVMSWFTDSDTL